jgi:hypothetical protein
MLELRKCRIQVVKTSSTSSCQASMQGWRLIHIAEEHEVERLLRGHSSTLSQLPLDDVENRF